MSICMVDSCNYTIICFDFLFSRVANEFEDSKGILSLSPTSSTFYALCRDLGAERGSEVVDGVTLVFAGGVDASDKGL